MTVWHLADDWWKHPAVEPLSLNARGLWASAMCWATHHDTDIIPESFLLMVGAAPQQAEELVKTGLWDELRPHFWRIRDWLIISPPKRRRSIPESVRQFVYRRDGRACVACRRTSDLTLDHRIPYSKGGPDTIENLQTMCRSCNSRKGDT